MKECRFYQKVDGEGEYASDTVRCELCPHCCVILEGKHGNVAADGILTECFTLLFTVNRVLWQMIL